MRDYRIEQIPRKKIIWPAQERKHFGQVELAELAATIRVHGILEAIGVVRDADGYQGLWGHRRYLAAELAGLELIPAVVRDKPHTEAEAMEIRLIENVARESLRPLEQAFGLDQFMKASSLTASEVARRVGMKPAAVTKSLTLLQLPEPIREKIDAGMISAGAGYELARVDDRKLQMEFAEQVASGALTRDALAGRIKAIQRQRGAYKSAVQHLSEGNVHDGFKQLNQLGWIKEVNATDRYKLLARDYVATVAEGKSALVVSPTHSEGDRVTAEIRSELKRTAKSKRKPKEFHLGDQERQFPTLQNAHLTPAQRRDGVNYSPDCDVLVFHQNAKGYRKGQRVTVGNGTLPLEQAERFSVYHTGTMSIAPGELIRITQNGTTADGEHRLNNGATYTVKDFTPAGDIRLNNGWTIAKDFGHVSYGYVATSHASQGKTVDRVFIGQSAQSQPASSQEQFYVSVSRGREQATIYTDDKQTLLEAVSHSDERLSATEFVAAREHREHVAKMQRVERQDERQREYDQKDREHRGMIHER